MTSVVKPSPYDYWHYLCCEHVLFRGILSHNRSMGRIERWSPSGLG